MTSLISGYICVRSNLSDKDQEYLWKDIIVPKKHTIMLSFKETVPFLTDVTLFRDLKRHSNRIRRSVKKKAQIWSRKSEVSDFAHLFQINRISVRVLRNSCINTTCFKLWFTFLSESQTPPQLASGQWNCSVSHYSWLIHHHMSCNLKAECQDGRDETGACAFSSTRCGGRLALCGRCYSIADHLKGFLSEHTELNKKANAYCNSLGSQLSLPKCLFDWYGTIRRKTKIHPKRLTHLWTGLYSYDILLPNMYVNSVSHLDRTVLHHSVGFRVDAQYFGTMCLETWNGNSKPMFHNTLIEQLCDSTKNKLFHKHRLAFGAFCEFKEEPEQLVGPSNAISLTASEDWPSMEQHSLIRCADGQITRTFLLRASLNQNIPSYAFPITFPDQLSTLDRGTPFQSFPCHTNTEFVPCTLVCDFLNDCRDASDERFCVHAPCINMFSCSSGQCLSFDKVCDYMFHCQDKSDETNCPRYKFRVRSRVIAIPSPVLVSFDGVQYFVSNPLSSNESCPASHYRCPGAFSDCLPVYTRCNGMYDCLGQQDEQGCEEALCPGLFRCRLSKQCLHADHLCDGWPHCPMNEDETACELTCPSSCLCQGHSFLCSRPFYARPFAQLRSLDATGSAMTLSDLGDNGLLVAVLLARCSLTKVPPVPMLNLRRLDLSHNRLQHVNLSCFLAMPSLQVLLLSHNRLTTLSSDPVSTGQHGSLTELQLSHVSLTMLDTGAFSLFPGLVRLNLTFSAIHTVSSAGFRSTPLLTELHAEGSPLTTFPPTLFQGLAHLRWLSSDNYKLCCSEILPANFNRSACLAPRDEISSCRDLLRWWTYRGFLWLMAALAVTGNVFSFAARALLGTVASSGFSVLVSSLGLADLLMGVYVAIIGAADRHFRGCYLHNDDRWKSSALCGAAGCVSLVSSEVSALTIAFITLDRFLVLRFPFSGLRFSPQAAALTCAQIWLLGWLLALVPLLPATRHWRFYSQTGICIPLPVTRRHFAGKPYAVSVLILLNFLLFLLVSAGQAAIYRSIRSNRMTTGSSTRVSRDVTIARRLIAVAVTDFLCWFPIGVCGMLSLAGVAVPGEVSVALAIFVLPLNSAINPWIYTLNSMADRRRKSREATFLKLLASQLEFAGERHAN